jgi:hypothetical protein
MIRQTYPTVLISIFELNKYSCNFNQSFIISLLLYSTERKEKHYNSVFFIRENFPMFFPCLLSVINYVFWEQTLKDNYVGNFTFYYYSK